MSKTAYILIAHGAREPSWATSLENVRNRIAANRPDVRLELSFMELMAPNFASCAEKVIAEGYRAIRIVPLFLARGGHLVHDIPELVNELRARYPDVFFEILDPVGEAPSVQQAMADHVTTLFADEAE